MKKIFSITSNFETKSTDDGNIKIRGFASTNDADRVGDVITSDAWTRGGLENFKKNPIILFNHNYDRPIGKAINLEPNEKGLEIEAVISKSAADNIGGLITDSVLSAFSVGFRIKDADYVEETGGLIIKDAELFEVSVVSVPCNQNAIFSVAKSFDSENEYRNFIDNLDSVDLAGQSLASKEEKSSKVASDTPEEDAKSSQETQMTSEEIKQLMKQVAKETADNIAMERAKEKAAAEKAQKEKDEQAAAEKAQEEKVQAAIETGLESGADRLVKDLEKRLEEKDAKIDEILADFKKDLEEKNDELKSMRDSKRVFDDRGNGRAKMSDWGREFMEAHLLGVMTGKGYDTDFARDVFEKAGIDYTTSAPDLDQEVGTQIEKEVTLNLRTAQLFREIRVNGAATVLPIQPDVNPATFQTGAASGGNLENRGATNSTYQPDQVILNAYRLISQTYMDNNVDEQVLVNLMPMLVDSVARAHARAVDNAVLNGSGNISGLSTYATSAPNTLSIGGGAALTAADLMAARKQMGKYGISPEDVAYIVSQARYYELIEDGAFQDITDVGSNVATKITGSIGAVYGSPVIISDSFDTETTGTTVAYAVATRNYVIPRLRGVTVERDYEVGNQRNVIVATQALGFEEMVADNADNQSAVKIDLAA